jgi:hypothetical protein
LDQDNVYMFLPVSIHYTMYSVKTCNIFLPGDKLEYPEKTNNLPLVTDKLELQRNNQPATSH